MVKLLAALIALFGGSMVLAFYGPRAYDSAVMLHNPGTDLTATATGTGVVVDGTPFTGIWIRLTVPQATGTNPTLDAVIQESDTLGSGYTANTTFDQVTAAGVFWRKVTSKRKHLRSVLTVAGTSPNFGKVQCGPATGPEYKG